MKLFPSLLIVLVLTSCASVSNQHIQSYVDPNFTAQNHMSFKIEHPGNQVDFVSPIQMLDQSISASMTSKGYSESKQTPDLIIRYVTTLEQQDIVDMQHTPTKTGIYTSYKMESVKLAAFLVNIIDAKTQKVVWKASTTKDITGLKREDLKQENIDNAINNIFESFPTK